ncbi:Bax inhibitor-1/YccA family protein [Adhaeribacter aquaticus]|uniref:Bax inhibitor-1/YccA family protein n=1 Tax=Adhaeribacter aquaticus TaxID=299567 RepID=UPI00041DB247|nr:Bax inhibitor-1/YccA family protein [Adhaeribacter aquaticus]
MLDSALLLNKSKVLQPGFMAKVYGWMSLALAITAVTSAVVASSDFLLSLIFANKITFYGLLIAQVLLVLYLGAKMMDMASGTAALFFLFYAFLNGVTLSVIFMAYTAASVASTFLITAGTFGAMSIYGFVTKKDLSSWGNILMMALLGLIIASVVNMFFYTEMVYWITSCAGVLIFVGLTAYDTQKIKAIGMMQEEGSETEKKTSLLAALSLYLDFINLFLYMLRFFGNRR